ncbi:MAG TPA: tyrosine-protein phosphatase [Blastocatellia bacterium]|nr:tyrosine-protein phosphatase [Blastocatellia bacterium]
MKRSVFSQRTFRPALAVFLALSILPASFAGADSKRHAKRGTFAVDIENFGQVNDHIYRGGQPKGDNYRQLAALGVKTVVDLRGDAEPDARSSAEQAGLRYINLPLEPKHYPQAGAAKRFLEIANDETNWPLYVHCAGGRHRTGVMVAVYRMTVDHWTIEQAWDEMKQYDFYTSRGHGCYKDYVFDYYRNLQAHNQARPAAASSAANTTN